DFAFACWEPEKQELFLCRDHMGVRPLAFGRVDGGVAVASHVAGLMALPGFDRDPDPFAVAMLLTNWWPDREVSWHRGARRLPGGHQARIARGGRISIAPYWQLEGE